MGRADDRVSRGDQAAARIPAQGRPAVPRQRSQTERGPGQKVTGGDIAALRSVGELFRALDHAYGGGHARQALVRYLEHEAEPMLRGAYGEQTGRRLFAAAADLTRLAGWTSYDIGAHGLAQRYFVQALRLSQAAGDRAYGSYVLVTVGPAGGLPRPRARGRAARPGRAAGRRLVRAARRPGAAALRGGARARRTRRGAGLHGVAGARRAGPRIRSAGVEAPHWARFFDEAQLADEYGHCHRDLQQYRAAAQHAERSLQLRAPGFARSRLFCRVVLASARLGLGELDQACLLGAEAAGRAAEMRSVRAVVRTGLQSGGSNVPGRGTPYRGLPGSGGGPGLTQAAVYQRLLRRSRTGVQVHQEGVGGPAAGIQGALDRAGVPVVPADVQARQEAHRTAQVVRRGHRGDRVTGVVDREEFPSGSSTCRRDGPVGRGPRCPDGRRGSAHTVEETSARPAGAREGSTWLMTAVCATRQLRSASSSRAGSVNGGSSVVWCRTVTGWKAGTRRPGSSRAAARAPVASRMARQLSSPWFFVVTVVVETAVTSTPVWTVPGGREAARSSGQGVRAALRQTQPPRRERMQARSAARLEVVRAGSADAASRGRRTVDRAGRQTTGGQRLPVGRSGRVRRRSGGVTARRARAVASRVWSRWPPRGRQAGGLAPGETGGAREGACCGECAPCAPGGGGGGGSVVTAVAAEQHTRGERAQGQGVQARGAVQFGVRRGQEPTDAVEPEAVHLLRRHAAAHGGGDLQNLRREACPGQVLGGRESRGSGPDDDDVHVRLAYGL